MSLPGSLAQRTVVMGMLLLWATLTFIAYHGTTDLAGIQGLSAGSSTALRLGPVEGKPRDVVLDCKFASTCPDWPPEHAPEFIQFGLAYACTAGMSVAIVAPTTAQTNLALELCHESSESPILEISAEDLVGPLLVMLPTMLIQQSSQHYGYLMYMMGQQASALASGSPVFPGVDFLLQMKPQMLSTHAGLLADLDELGLYGRDMLILQTSQLDDTIGQSSFGKAAGKVFIRAEAAAAPTRGADLQTSRVTTFPAVYPAFGMVGEAVGACGQAPGACGMLISSASKISDMLSWKLRTVKDAAIQFPFRTQGDIHTAGLGLVADGGSFFKVEVEDQVAKIMHWALKQTPAGLSSVVLDIGANAGYFTYLAASMHRHVLSFEPQLPCQRIIHASRVRTLAPTSMYIHPCPVGLDMEIMEVPLVGDACDPTVSFAGQRVQYNAHPADPDAWPFIYTRPLSAIVQAYDDAVLRSTGEAAPPRIPMLKMDSEGHEIAILRSAKGLISSERVERMIIEIMPWGWGQDISIEEGTNDLCSLLELGYRAYFLHDNSYPEEMNEWETQQVLQWKLPWTSSCADMRLVINNRVSEAKSANVLLSRMRPF